MNVPELINAWNDLRNRVMGRGASKPAGISDELYRSMGASYEEWRQFLYDNPAYLQYFGAVELADWPGSRFVDRYRALQGWAASEGVDFEAGTPGFPATLDEGLTERVRDLTKEAKKQVEDLGQKLEMGLVVVALGFGAVIALRAFNK